MSISIPSSYLLINDVPQTVHIKNNNQKHSYHIESRAKIKNEFEFEMITIKVETSCQFAADFMHKGSNNMS
jgi:hypothetical protein